MWSLLWVVSVPWVGGVSGQTATTSASPQSGLTAVPTQTTTALLRGPATAAQTTKLKIEEEITVCLAELEQASKPNPSQESSLNAEFFAQNSRFSVGYSSIGALGLPLLSLAGVAAFIRWWRRHGKMKYLVDNLESSGVAGGVIEKTELDANNTRHELGGRSTVPEVDGVSRYEIDGQARPHEADGTQRYQLAGESRAHEVKGTERHELDATEQQYLKVDEENRPQSENGNIPALSRSPSGRAA